MDGIAEEASSPGGSLRYVQMTFSHYLPQADTSRFSHTNAVRLSNHSNPSPDIGPPPIVHFDNEDPIKFDPLSAETDHPSYSEQDDHPTSDHESLPANLSVNLETRRKRKDSKVQLRRSSLLPPDLDDDDQPQLTRTSAKRKLSMRDVEDEVEKRVVKDDFKFSRRSSLAADFMNTEPVTAPAESLEDTETPALLPERKVLGNKSVNVSPRKLSRGTKGKGDVKKEEAPLKPAVKATDRRKSKNPSTKSVTIATSELVSKMRRPTAAKADAVDVNGRRISSNISTSEKKTMRTVIIKGDDMNGSLTRDMGSEAPSPLGQKVDREHERTFESNKAPSASGRAISALMAGSKKQEKGPSEDAGIYELKDSSDVEESGASRKRNSRRHSSMTDSSERSSNGAELEMEAEEKQEEAEVRKAPRSARVDRSGARRRSMMV